jgi:hypothetical protein
MEWKTEQLKQESDEIEEELCQKMKEYEDVKIEQDAKTAFVQDLYQKQTNSTNQILKLINNVDIQSKEDKKRGEKMEKDLNFKIGLCHDYGNKLESESKSKNL